MISRESIHQIVDQVDEARLDELHRVVREFTVPGARGVVIDDALSAEFHRLADQWREDTEFISSLHEMSTHPAYQRIIGMGKAAVPLILQELQQDPDYWFWALTAITGEDPVPPGSRGRLDAMAEAWLQWGRDQNLIGDA